MREKARLFMTSALGLAWLGLFAACRRDMYDQPRVDRLEPSRFFPNGASARRPPAGTVHRSDLRQSAAIWSGTEPGGAFLTEPPTPVNRQVLARGREQYEVFCTPCHGFLGDGNGMIVQRGFRRPPSFHVDRLREQPIGYFTDVIANGFGVMPSYADKVSPEDRWAIAAFIGALQLSQSAGFADLLPEDAARVLEGSR